MTHRRRIALFAGNALVALLLSTGCGDFDSGEDSATGGAATGGVASSTGGTTPTTGGTAATTGGTATATGGSGGGPSSCTNVTACGGDVVGTWTAMSSCLAVSGNLDMTGFGLGCTSAPATGSLQVTGSWTVNADATYTDSTVTTGNQAFELPAPCLNVSGTITACDRISAPLAAAGFATASCLDAASGGCSCAATVNQEGGPGFVSTNAESDGDYTIADNVITLSARRFEAQYSYCVSGTTLTMTLVNASPSGSVMGTIVFQKQ